jgi:hypothetical protein
MYIDDLNFDGQDMQAYLRTWNYGQLIIFASDDGGQTWDENEILIFDVNGVTENTGYFTISLDYLSGWSDAIDSEDICFFQFVPGVASTGQVWKLIRDVAPTTSFTQCVVGTSTGSVTVTESILDGDTIAIEMNSTSARTGLANIITVTIDSIGSPGNSSTSSTG